MLFQHILYLSPEGTIAGPADIRVEGGKIAAIAERLPLEKGESSYDGSDRLLLPAFANPHCHVPMTLLRGQGEGLPLQEWLSQKIFPFEALLNEDDMYWGSLLGIAEMLASGCVSFSDMYMREKGIIRAVRETGIKANLCYGTTAFKGEERFEETDALRETEDILEGAKSIEGQRLIADLSIHGEYTSNEALVRSTIKKAEELGLRMQIHLSETRAEHEACKKRHGCTPLAYFDRCGIFKVPVTFAHAVYLEDSDFALLSKAVREGADISLVHNPSSNLKLGSGFADLKRWFQAGVNVCIGTDGASSNNNLNVLEELNLAALLQKGVSGDPAFMPPKTVFSCASEAGFRSQGRLDSGRIEEGWRADLSVFNLDLPSMRPSHDLLSNLLFSAPSSALVLTMADGRVLYEDGKWLTLDIRRVMREVERIAEEKRRLLNS